MSVITGSPMLKVSGVDDDGLTSACPQQAKVAPVRELQLHSAKDMKGHLSGGAEATLTGNRTYNKDSVINRCCLREVSEILL